MPYNHHVSPSVRPWSVRDYDRWVYFDSELAVAWGVAPCGADRRPARASSMVQHTYVSLLSNQTGNKHFACSLSGSQLMKQIYLYLPGPNGKNPAPESGTNILTV